jgi:uncharacterized protein YpbB
LAIPIIAGKVSETAYTAYAASDFTNNVIAPKTSQNLRYHRFRERIEVEEVWETVRLKCSTFDQHVEEILAPYV